MFAVKIIEYKVPFNTDVKTSLEGCIPQSIKTFHGSEYNVRNIFRDLFTSNNYIMNPLGSAYVLMGDLIDKDHLYVGIAVTHYENVAYDVLVVNELIERYGLPYDELMVCDTANQESFQKAKDRFRKAMIRRRARGTSESPINYYLNDIDTYRAFN